MSSELQLWEVARAIYSAPLAEFIGVRTQQASDLKQAGDAENARRVAAFKKPSAAADLVNQLVRQAPDLTEEIDDLGARLRAAQAEADATTLRNLDRERRTLVGRCVAWAREQSSGAGKGATDATLRDVEQTVWASIIDATAGATVRAGVLVRPLLAGGFSGVDVTGASAIEVTAPDEPARPARRVAKAPAGPAGPAKASKPSGAADRARKKAQENLQTAQAAGRQTQRQLEEAADAAEAAVRSLDDLQEQRERLRQELSDVEHRLKSARQDVSDRRADLKTAEKQRRSAAAEIDRALRQADET